VLQKHYIFTTDHAMQNEYRFKTFAYDWWYRTYRIQKWCESLFKVWQSGMMLYVDFNLWFSLHFLLNPPPTSKVYQSQVTTTKTKKGRAMTILKHQSISLQSLWCMCQGWADWSDHVCAIAVANFWSLNVSIWVSSCHCQRSTCQMWARYFQEEFPISWWRISHQYL